MMLSVVIPAFNEERLLPATLTALRESLKPLNAAGWQTEIIVCDNNSTDATARIAAEAGAIVVFEPVNMIARARNAGAAAARGDWILFLDADSTPSPELIADVAHHIGSGRVFAGGSTVRMDSGPFPVHFAAASWNLTSRIARWPAGSFIFVDAAVFRDVGGFATTQYVGEEIELARRLKRSPLRRGRRLIILSQHPLITSARKLRLYRPGEFLRFFLRAVLRPRHTTTSREACDIWYDGRR
jgi:glycosyltransferase involved in cell wall biosynthesis